MVKFVGASGAWNVYLWKNHSWQLLLSVRGGLSDEHLDKWRMRNETDGSFEIKQKLEHAPRLWKPLKTRSSSLGIIAY